MNLPEPICYIGKYKLTDSIEGHTIGKLLLSPTRTFVPVLIPILEKYRNQIHGIVHNTGGGQTKCMKYIPGKLRVVKDNLFTPPLMFNLIQEASGISTTEMYEVFNMGTRLEIYVPPAIADDIVTIAQQFGIEARQVGYFEAATEKHLDILPAH